jgi:hypothetical protein
VVEAIMAQESNWSQASWHAPRGITGDPLVADYYGYNATGTIDYLQVDCGYGLGQITSIMTAGATNPWTGAAVPQTLQDKVAVDYAENATATATATAYYLAGGPVQVLDAGLPLRPLPDGVTSLDQFRIQRRDRAGGVIHEYRLVA